MVGIKFLSFSSKASRQKGKHPSQHLNFDTKPKSSILTRSQLFFLIYGSLSLTHTPLSQLFYEFHFPFTSISPVCQNLTIDYAHARMDIRSWCNSGASESIRLGRCPHRRRDGAGGCSGNSGSNSPASSGLKKLSWKQLWMKLKRERRRIMLESGSFEGHVHGPYDFHNYSQNFDHGIASEEPENLSRSFSVRFANPSRIFVRKKGGKK